MRLAPEGRPFVAGAGAALALALLAALLMGGAAWLAPVLVAPPALWVPWFFRDPSRPGPRGAHLLLAPADGRVVSVGEVTGDPWAEAAVRVSIFMNVLDVHVNRAPADGEVTDRAYRPGRFVNATLDKASEHNERMSLTIQTARGPVVVRQIAGFIARRVVTDPAVGERVRQGERFGIIRFGSRVDTFAPRRVQPRVAVGDRAVAGVTVIAEWPA